MEREHRKSGQSLVEFALLLPILLLILAGLLDLARGYYVYVALTDAAAEGAAYAAIHPSDFSEVVARVQDASGGGVQIDPDGINMDCPTVSAGQPVTVSVRYTYTVVTPLLNSLAPDGQIALRSSATEVIISSN